MEQKKKLKKVEIEQTLKLLKSLPENRRFFYSTGILMIEVTKEEALKILKEKMGAMEETV